MDMGSSSTAVVHVTLERFFDDTGGLPRARRLDELMTLTDHLDRALERHGSGWLRPSADEAVLVANEPWGTTATPMDWAGALRDAVGDDVGLECSVGIAATRVAARICSRMARPRGVLLWLSGYEEGLIASLPLEELDELSPEQLAKLRAGGVRTMGELAALAPEDARALLGSQSAKLTGLVRGFDRATALSPGSRLSRAVSLLSRRLERRLVRAGRRARGLELRLVFEGGVVRERYTLLPRAVVESSALDAGAQRLLAMASFSERSVVGLSLTATGLTSPDRQLPLFSRTRPREVSVTLGRSGPSEPGKPRAT